MVSFDFARCVLRLVIFSKFGTETVCLIHKCRIISNFILSFAKSFFGKSRFQSIKSGRYYSMVYISTLINELTIYRLFRWRIRNYHVCITCKSLIHRSVCSRACPTFRKTRTYFSFRVRLFLIFKFSLMAKSLFGSVRIYLSLKEKWIVI